MSLAEVLEWCGGAAVLLLTFVELAPIRLDPWSALLSWLGRGINGELLGKVEALEQEVRQLRQRCEEQSAVDCRSRILRFGDELLHQVHHSKEHFDQILRDVQTYEEYCRTHPDFVNNTTQVTTQQILEIYRQCMADRAFL